MTVPYLKEAALLEDVANELIQVHQTLVVPDMMCENGQHHGVLWKTDRIVKKGRDGRGKIGEGKETRRNTESGSCLI